MEPADITGNITRVADSHRITLERTIPHDQDTVWRMLTDPERLAQWLAPGTIEQRTGGAVCLDFPESGATIDSTVREIDPPHLLEYSWSSGTEPARPLRWTLTAGDDDTTHLRFELSLPEAEDPAKAAAGWDAHLEMLLAALEGVAIGFPVQRFKAARAYFEGKRDG